MMTEPIFESGALERLKFGVHLVLFGGSIAALLYNAGTACARGATHSKVNVAAYAALSAFEVGQLYRHAEGIRNTAHLGKQVRP